MASDFRIQDAIPGPGETRRWGELYGGALACRIAELAAVAAAQEYPAKTVTVVVPQAPGGATDVFARFMAQKLGESLGLPLYQGDYVFDVESGVDWSKLAVVDPCISRGRC